MGNDYEGIIVCDCLRTFDAMDRDQQKCLAHLLRAGLRLKQRREHISPHGYKVACGRLEAALDRLLDGALYQ